MKQISNAVACIAATNELLNKMLPNCRQKSGDIKMEGKWRNQSESLKKKKKDWRSTNRL